MFENEKSEKITDLHDEKLISDLIIALRNKMTTQLRRKIVSLVVPNTFSHTIILQMSQNICSPNTFSNTYFAFVAKTMHAKTQKGNVSLNS